MVKIKNYNGKIPLCALKICFIVEQKDELESFFEQYICSCSSKFIYTGGIHAKPTHTHLRSTWSSFVLEYRIFKNKNNNNIYLQELL